MCDHVLNTFLSMTKEEREEVRKELLKTADAVKTGFGDYVILKHPILSNDQSPSFDIH